MELNEENKLVLSIRDQRREGPEFQNRSICSSSGGGGGEAEVASHSRIAKRKKERTLSQGKIGRVGDSRQFPGKTKKIMTWERRGGGETVLTRGRARKRSCRRKKKGTKISSTQSNKKSVGLRDQGEGRKQMRNARKRKIFRN